MRRLFAVLILLTCSALGATHYIWVSAVGTGTGADFTNAFTNLQASPVCGDTYVIAGDAAKYAPVTVNTDCSSNPAIYRKAKTSDSGVAGYQAAFVSTTAIWQDTTNVDPGAASSSVLILCGGGFQMDGVTGNTDPVTGPSGFGIKILSANMNKSGKGLIGIGCTSPYVPNLSNVSFKNIEYGGTGNMPYFGQTVNCSYAGGTLTLTTADSSNFPFIAGDKVDGWGPINQQVFPTGGSTLTAATVTGGTLTITTATNYCATTPPVYQVALAGFPFYGILVHQGNPDGSGSPISFSNISVTYDYFHDATEGVRLDNCSACTIDHNYMANNRSTIVQHGSMVQLGETTNLTVSGPITVSNNFFLNANGTGAPISHLGQPTACGVPPCGTINGIYIIGNFITCNQLGLNRCLNGYNFTDNNSTCVTHLLFANNVIANFNSVDGTGAVTGHAGVTLTSSCSNSGNVAYNNVCYNGNYNCFYSAAGGASLTHDYNTVLNVPTRSFTPNAHEFVKTSGAIYPFVDISVPFNLALSTDVGAIPLGCVLGTSCFQDGTNTHATLPANDVDYYGTARNSGNGWDRGALQFVPVASNYLVTLAGAGNANGKVCTDGATCTDGILNAVSTAGVISGVSTHTFTAGATATLTATATSGSFIGFSGGGCTTSPCTITVNAPLTITATFQTSVTCTLTCVKNNLNSPETDSCTATLTGLSGLTSLWYITDPNNNQILFCGPLSGGCYPSGSTGNLPYTGSGTYTLNALSNGVPCAQVPGTSTQPLNVNTGAGSAAH